MLNNPEIRCIVVDDSPHERAETANSLQVALNRLGVFNSAIIQPEGLIEALRLVVSRPSTPMLVFMDHHFDGRNWRGSWNEIHQEMVNVDWGARVEIIQESSRVAKQKIAQVEFDEWDGLPDKLFELSDLNVMFEPHNGLDLGFLLRVGGFEGKMICVSNEPPEPLDWALKARVLTDILKFDVRGFDGMTIKRPLSWSNNEIVWADEKDGGELWMNQRIASGSLVDSLEQLLMRGFR